MSVYDYASVIKLVFDKPIASEVDIPSGYGPPKAIEISGSASGSSYYYTYVPANAFDGNKNTYWYTRNSLPQYLQYDFEEAKEISKIALYNGASYRSRRVVIKASTNNVDWDTIKTVDLPNSTGWTYAEFDPIEYQYWRFEVTLKWDTYTILNEIVFYSPTIAYVVSGWTVSSQEYKMQPEGSLMAVEYQVRRVTKSEDGYSVFLWLDLPSRMKDPQGLVTVSYSKTLGNLQGEYGSVIDDFEITFTPTSITPIFNPHDVERIEADISVISELIFITKYYCNEPEYVEVDVTVESEIIHVDDLPE